MGAILGAFIGMLDLWLFKVDAAHFWAAVAAGSTYMAILAVFGAHFQRGGGMTLLGAVSGFVAAIVWWTIAVHTQDSFALAAISGVCFGSAYVWSEARKGP